MGWVSANLIRVVFTKLGESTLLCNYYTIGTFYEGACLHDSKLMITPLLNPSQILLADGRAEVDVPDNDNATALHAAVQAGREEVVDKLVRF